MNVFHPVFVRKGKSMGIVAVGIDLAKNVFALHSVDETPPKIFDEPERRFSLCLRLRERNRQVAGNSRKWPNVEVRGSRSEAEGTQSTALGCPVERKVRAHHWERIFSSLSTSDFPCGVSIIAPIASLKYPHTLTSISTVCGSFLLS